VFEVLRNTLATLRRPAIANYLGLKIWKLHLVRQMIF
jgi:hypothetical protein